MDYTHYMKDFDAIVESELMIPKESIRDELTPKDVPHWDSMSYLLFIAELERQYGVSFTMDEVLGASSLGSVKELLRAKGASV